ncbi:MAG: hypothetical protein J5967_07930, partial [Oscillospiraceae bacterium]|nr:hypothetical protein [Oscillospiraceae bacterium]
RHPGGTQEQEGVRLHTQKTQPFRETGTAGFFVSGGFRDIPQKEREKTVEKQSSLFIFRSSFSLKKNAASGIIV